MSEFKQGYKQTKVGIIPEDWEVGGLSKIANVEIYPKASEDGDQDKDPAFNLLFPDGSKADLQTYVEDPNNFANFKSEMEKFADDMAPSKDEEPVYVD
jgi:hypothetical protein